MVTPLLSKGANTKSNSGDYGSAVMLAASGGHVNIVRQLLALHLAPVIQGSEPPGQPTKFSEQLEQGIADVMALAHDVKNFFDALETVDISTMKVILASGLDVNIRDGMQQPSMARPMPWLSCFQDRVSNPAFVIGSGDLLYGMLLAKAMYVLYNSC